MLNRTINLLYTRNIHQTKRLWFSSIIPENKRIIPVTKKVKEHKIYNKSDNVLRAIKSEELNQKQYFLKDDPDLFGSLTTPVKDLLHEDPQNEGDLKEEELLSNPVSSGKKLSTKQYAEIIKKHIQKRQIKEAIDVLEIRMIQEDKAKPENYIYNLVLGACGRVGYTKKAFKLFNDMKKRGLKPTNGTYTALFNACSNSPWLEDGLTRATNLRELIHEKGVILNDTNYNAMIKAFGRCGDLNTAFSLVDEMIANRISIKSDTINFLLHSCISDTEAGFRHALLVWRKFHNKNIKPDIYSFNLMLRCIRDCNIGNVETMRNLLETPEFKFIENSSQLKLENNANEQNGLDLISSPNLLAPTPYLGNIIRLNEITKPEDRLLLVGGCCGFLKNMEYFHVKPDIKTFTQLLDSIPTTIAAENLLISTMKKECVKFDVDFLNMLVRKRSMRFDYENARAVIKTLFKPPKLRPNLITYGVLALSCESKEQANELINEMKDAGYRLNVVILGSMLKQACIKMNFVYVLELMEVVIKEQIEPNKIFIQHLEDLYKRAKHESNENNKCGQFFTKGFKIFRGRYKTWLTEINIDTSDEQHPWDQFRNPTNVNAKHYKDKEVHFKPRVTSRFKVKTGTLNKKR